MLIRINAESTSPLFEQVAAAVRTELASGNLAPGDRLPPAKEIAAALDINVHTVLRAYQQLRDEGLIDLRRGRGAVVTAAAGPLAALRADVASLVARAATLGLSPAALAALVKESAS